MRTLRIVLVVSVVVILAPVFLCGQTLPDLSGTWRLNSSSYLAGEENPCVFSGQAVLTQDGTQISGTAQQSLASGPTGCPAEMSASLSGFFDVGQQQVVLTGTLEGGNLGMASFNGELSRTAGGNGTVLVNEGPFAGTHGTWTAWLAGTGPGIPALTPIGLTVLALLLLAGGGLMLRRLQPEFP